MLELILIKGKSYTGAVHATEQRPQVEVEQQETADYLVDSGYFKLVGGSAETPPDTQADADISLTEMSLKQLQEYARENGIDLNGATRKDDVLAAILEAEDNSDPADDFVGGSE